MLGSDSRAGGAKIVLAKGSGEMGMPWYCYGPREGARRMEAARRRAARAVAKKPREVGDPWERGGDRREVEPWDLRDWREALQLSREDLAGVCEVRPRDWAEAELGRKKLGPASCAAIRRGVRRAMGMMGLDPQRWPNLARNVSRNGRNVS